MKFAHFSHVWAKAGMTPTQRYAQLWRELQLCDARDFDYGFCVEHHFDRHESWMSAPNLYAVGAGARTQRIRLGAMGHIVPLHNPLRLLEEIATVDQMLDGRLELGLVPGIRADNFPPFGADFQVDRREKTQEFVRLLKTVYGADAREFSFDGRFSKFERQNLAVPPAQKPYPPMWMETRDPATLEFCAREGLNTGYFIFFPRPEAKRRYAPYLEAWKKAGWPRKPNIGYLTLVYVGDTDEEAIATASPHIKTAFRGFFEAGLDEAGLQRAAEHHALNHEKRGDKGGGEIARHMFDPPWLIENQHVLVGSPETVAKQLRAWAVEGSFNTFFGEFNFGEMDETTMLRSIDLFGRHVIPALREFEPY